MTIASLWSMRVPPERRRTAAAGGARHVLRGHAVAIILIALVTLALAAGCGAATAEPTGRCVVRAELVGIVNAASAEYLEDAVHRAEADCDAAIVVVDTPGGDLESTRRIAQLFLEANVPVVAWVGPGGARAGSAGMFVVLAAHVAAMAPGSNIGAAHPVALGGGDPEAAGGEHLGHKVVNDTAAFSRALAEHHGRNADWAEDAVRESRSATASEARALDVIDLVVQEGELLGALHGRRVEMRAGPVTLSTRDAAMESAEMTWSQSVRDVLGHPTLVYALLLVGVLGLVIEAYSPGMIVPGTAGAMALLLAVIGLDAIPIRIAALALIGAAAVLFVAEVHVTSFGLLTLVGLGALVLGASLLVDRSDPEFFVDPTLHVSWGVIVPLTLLLVTAVGGLAVMAARTRGRRSPTGAEGLVGTRGRSLTAIDGTGQVRIDGERWQARSSVHIHPGAPVEVVGVEGLRLVVTPTDEPGETR